MQEKDIIAVLECGFSLALPQATLTRTGNDPDNVKPYQGAADIAMDEDGKLTLRLMCPPDFMALQDMFRTFNVRPGEIIPSDCYYRLEGTAINGDSWTSERILPCFQAGDGGTVVTATLDELKRIAPVRPAPAADEQHTQNTITSFFRVKANFFGYCAENYPSDFPKHPLHSMMIRGLVVQDSQWQLVLIHNKEWVSSHFRYPKKWERTRVIERLSRSLEFLFGQFMESAADIAQAGSEIHTVLRSTRQESRKSPYPMIRYDHPGHVAEAVALLKLAINTLLLDPSSDRPPLATYMRQAISAMRQPLDIAALNLGVAIEGFLSCEFSDIQQGDLDTLSGEISVAQQLMQGRDDLSDSFKRRVAPILGSLKNTRAKDRLVNLEKNGKLPQGSTKAWEALRHPAVHPGQSSRVEVDPLYKQCCAGLALLYRLMFIKMGYQGNYIDYSASGWPQAQWKV